MEGLLVRSQASGSNFSQIKSAVQRSFQRRSKASSYSTSRPSGSGRWNGEFIQYLWDSKSIHEMLRPMVLPIQAELSWPQILLISVILIILLRIISSHLRVVIGRSLLESLSAYNSSSLRLPCSWAKRPTTHLFIDHVIISGCLALLLSDKPLR